MSRARVIVTSGEEGESMVWVLRIVIEPEDETMTKEIYEFVQSLNLKFNLRYGSDVLFYIKCTDVMKALEMAKLLNEKFHRKFNNNIYESSERGR